VVPVFLFEPDSAYLELTFLYLTGQAFQFVEIRSEAHEAAARNFPAHAPVTHKPPASKRDFNALSAHSSLARVPVASSLQFFVEKIYAPAFCPSPFEWISAGARLWSHRRQI